MPASHRVYVPGEASSSRTPTEYAAAAMGTLFLLIGLLGFLRLAGVPELDVFAVTVEVGFLQLVLGGAGITASRTHRLARPYLIGGGIVYAVFAVGHVVTPDALAGGWPAENVKNGLHLGLPLVMIALGNLLSRHPKPPTHEIVTEHRRCAEPGTRPIK